MITEDVCVCVCLRFLTHPDLSEAALAQFEVQTEGLPGDLPGILGQALGLGLHRGTHRGQPVAQAVSVFWREKAGGGGSHDPLSAILSPLCREKQLCRVSYSC